MPIRVLASVIERDNRLLVCRRPLHKRHGGLGEFPAGKGGGGGDRGEKGGPGGSP